MYKCKCLILIVLSSCTSVVENSETTVIPKNVGNPPTLTSTTSKTKGGLVDIFGSRPLLKKNEFLITIDMPYLINQKSNYNLSHDKLNKYSLSDLDTLVENCRLKTHKIYENFNGRIVLIFSKHDSEKFVKLNKIHTTGYSEGHKAALQSVSNCIKKDFGN
jgi:hypothetical protein